MKNITVSVDEKTYRRARIVAAERDSSVSRLVRDYLKSLGATQDESKGGAALFAALDKAKGFRAGDRLTREEAHAR